MGGGETATEEALEEGFWGEEFGRGAHGELVGISVLFGGS